MAETDTPPTPEEAEAWMKMLGRAALIKAIGDVRKHADSLMFVGEGMDDDARGLAILNICKIAAYYVDKVCPPKKWRPLHLGDEGVVVRADRQYAIITDAIDNEFCLEYQTPHEAEVFVAQNKGRRVRMAQDRETHVVTLKAIDVLKIGKYGGKHWQWALIAPCGGVLAMSHERWQEFDNCLAEAEVVARRFAEPPYIDTSAKEQT